MEPEAVATELIASGPVRDFGRGLLLSVSNLFLSVTMKLIADSMYDEYKDPNCAPPPLLLRMVEAGRLGKKSGKGFFKY